MTHRLDVRKEREAVTFEFQGLLDTAAFEALRAAVQLAAGSGAAVRVLLREGTQVERSCVAGLRSLDAKVTAESAYLARWMNDPHERTER